MRLHSASHFVRCAAAFDTPKGVPFPPPLVLKAPSQEASPKLQAFPSASSRVKYLLPGFDLYLLFPSSGFSGEADLRGFEETHFNSLLEIISRRGFVDGACFKQRRGALDGTN